MRLPQETDLDRPSVNILPMIDVIFAILAFFVVSTLYLTRDEGLPVSLPQAVTATPQNQIDLTLTITPNGELYLGETPVALTNLASRVREQGAGRPVLVTIRADETTSHGRVVAAMDQLRTVETVSLGIATTRP
ncbi:MAG: biopolymer transporter ExbD [Cyanobacteria bacterium J06627_28]